MAHGRGRGRTGAQAHRRTGAQALTILAFASAGCGALGPDCVFENRSVTLEENFGNGFRGYVALDESRDADSKDVTLRRIIWAVNGTLDEGTLTAVHLHQGQSGPQLASLPVRNTRTGVLTDGIELNPSFLSMPFDELFEIVRTQPVHVDLHTTTAPQGIILGRLEIQFDNDWFHPFCS